MKKVFSLLLVVCMVLSLLTVGVVSASAQAFDAAITVGSDTYVADVGEVFTYTLYFESAKKLSAGQIELNVDQAVLSFDSEAALNSAIASHMPAASDTAAAFVTNNGVVFNFATEGSYDFSKDYALRLQFKVIAKGAVDLTPALREVIDADDHDIYDLNGQKLDGDFSHNVTLDLPLQNSYAVKAPRISSLSNAANGLKLTWNACEGAGVYRVFRLSGDNWKKVADTAATSYVDASAVSGSVNTYTVRAYTKDGKSPVSEYVRCGWSHSYMAAPVITGFENLDNALKIKWGAVKGAVKYRVFRKSGSKWLTVGDTDKTELQDTKVTAGTKYYYTVRCINADGSAASSYDNTGKAYIRIARTSVSSVECAVGGVQVKWAKFAGAAKYRVFRKTASSGWKKLVDTAATSVLDKTASSGATYYYTVRAITKDAKSYTSSYDTKGKGVTYYAAPAVPKLTLNTDSVTLKLTAVQGAYNYCIFRKVGTGSWTKLATTKSLTYTDKKVTSGKKYSYTVRCLSKDGKKYISAYNTTGSSVTYIAAPAAPTLKNSKKGVVISWKKSAGAAKYRILRKTGSGKWTKLADTKSLSYTDTSAKKGVKYSYTIRCITANGKSYTSAYNTKGTTITCKR